MLATIIAGRGFGAWLDRYQGFLDPQNPFISWLVIFDLAILLTHLFTVFWVYRDASWRYNRGAPWALFSFIFPLGGWLFYLVTCSALAFSAFFEMIEWWSALIWGGAADAFLATQGDVWDTQWDMFMALLGALSAQWLLARVHDRQLAEVVRAG